MPTLVTLNQDTDTPARREITPSATLIYLYDRSRDSKNGETPGQDFIAFCYDERRIAFAVCDGVSQSFYGDLAARFLGERLTAWFYGLRSVSGNLGDKVELTLSGWTEEATRLVQSRIISADLAPMIRDALERKRENGSESMFVAGLVDFEHRQLGVCWMGDMRLWLWDHAGQPVELPGAVWETRERWSSRIGPKNGRPRVAVLPLDHIARLTIHSDGIGSRATELQTITLDRLDQLAQELNQTPASDDVSVFDIWLGHVEAEPLAIPAPYTPDEREPVLHWDAVTGAEWYRVAIDTSVRQWTADTTSTTFFLPVEAEGYAECRVQALSNDHLPSAWSEPVTVVPGEAVYAEAVTLAQAELQEESVVVARRPFRFGLMMVSALVLALALSIGWYLLYLR